MIKNIIVCIIFCSCTKIALAQNKLPTVDSTRAVLIKEEVEAEFPGGQGAWYAFLSKNIKGKVPSKKGAPEGVYTVMIRFAVQKDGTLGDLAAETNYGYGMEEEVMRVIKKSPKWVAATQDGKEIKAYRRQPITFTVGKK